MTEDQAKAALEARLAPGDDPQLSKDDITYLLTFAKRADGEGRAPSHAEWTPTFDVDSASAEGWRIKAGRAAKMISFAEDGQRFSLSQVHAQCVTQEKMYRRRIVQSPAIALDPPTFEEAEEEASGSGS